MAAKVTRHDLAVRQVVQRLQALGAAVQLTVTGADMAVGDKRVVIRTSEGARKGRFAKSHAWQFYMGKSDRPDVYVLYIPPSVRYGFGVGIWLVIPSRELSKIQTFQVSVRSLLTKWGKWADRWDLLTSRNGKAAK